MATYNLSKAERKEKADSLFDNCDKKWIQEELLTVAEFYSSGKIAEKYALFNKTYRKPRIVTNNVNNNIRNALRKRAKEQDLDMNTCRKEFDAVTPNATPTLRELANSTAYRKSNHKDKAFDSSPLPLEFWVKAHLAITSYEDPEEARKAVQREFKHEHALSTEHFMVQARQEAVKRDCSVRDYPTLPPQPPQAPALPVAQVNQVATTGGNPPQSSHASLAPLNVTSSKSAPVPAPPPSIEPTSSASGPLGSSSRKIQRSPALVDHLDRPVRPLAGLQILLNKVRESSERFDIKDLYIELEKDAKELDRACEEVPVKVLMGWYSKRKQACLELAERIEECDRDAGTEEWYPYVAKCLREMWQEEVDRADGRPSVQSRTIPVEARAASEELGEQTQLAPGWRPESWGQ